MDLRYYLTFGLLLTALADFLFGFAHTVGVHSVAYFYVMEAFLGIVNSSGWPGVVTTLRCERKYPENLMSLISISLLVIGLESLDSEPCSGKAPVV